MPFKCPVCEGTGMVPQNFYNGSMMATATNQIDCRSCDGTGVIWSEKPQLVYYVPQYQWPDPTTYPQPWVTWHTTCGVSENQMTSGYVRVMS